METKNNKELMIWSDFKKILLQHPELALQFCYSEDARVNASYHITEIKQATIASVDCGGKLNNWTEIIVQLWEPSAASPEKAMAVNKALSIIDLVEKNLQLNPAGIAKIEFGNTHFDTRQLYPEAFDVEGEDLIVKLVPDFTQCKAINRGDACKPVEQDPSCCGLGAGCC